MSISLADARRLAIRAQGLGGARPSSARPPGATQLRRVMDTLGTIQLDAVNVLARTQFIVPFSRVGGYDPALFRSLSGPGQAWFEYWGHAASLMPLDLYPLLRWRMARWRDDLVYNEAYRERRRAWREAHAGYVGSVLAEVADRGPLAASQLSEPRRQTGEWWDRRSVGRRALELLFGDGVLAAWRSANFERVYDLAERVIPAEYLDQVPPPEEEAQRQLVLRAARSLGPATVGDLAEYFWLRPAVARERISELVGAGQLAAVAVEGWKEPAYMLPGARPGPLRREGATLLSPFDSLIWTRQRTHRLFGFHYRIEIYVPGHLRAHGYYVMPLLVSDQLVGRLDLKADRKASVLRVAAAYAEDGYLSGDVAEATTLELHRLRDWLGLEGLTVLDKGDLAPLLKSLSEPARRRGPGAQAVRTDTGGAEPAARRSAPGTHPDRRTGKSDRPPARKAKT